MTSYQRQCVRCRETRDLDVEFPETSMYWPTGVDYLDCPEPNCEELYLCPPCSSKPGVELYWQAFGFASDEGAVLFALYDAEFRGRHNITETDGLN